MVTVTAYANVHDALTALAETEYREFLKEAGCPADKIEGEVQKMLESRKAA